LLGVCPQCEDQQNDHSRTADPSGTISNHFQKPQEQE
jgi:hypothetical protein